MSAQSSAMARQPASEVLVIGAGVAGLATALAAAPRAVRVLDAGAPGGDGASIWAQGGIAAAVGTGDAPAQHAADTLAAGQWRNDPVAVRHLTERAPDVIDWLERLGVRFDRDGDGALLLGREAAHGRMRIVHARGDATGAEVMRALTRVAVRCAHIAVAPQCRAFALARADDGRVVGAWAWNGHAVELWPARAVVLATGGYAALYHHTTNPAGNDGGGIALALAAGAAVADLEFVQFHPTALALPGASGQLPLLTEALRGAGAVLIDGSGQRFMPAEHPLAELAPRDVVARAVAARALSGHAVFLDARAAVGAAFPEHFPTVFAACMQAGIDPRMQPVPITPAAHYCMGGVRVDADARSSLDGLYAVGEAACTGVHGANRLASNSLLEGLVFGRALGQHLATALPGAAGAALPCPRTYAPLDAATRAALADVLWTHAGLVRDEAGLAHAATRIAAWRATRAPGASAADLLDLAAALIAAMRARRECVGAHWRRDVRAAA